ncbi:unnamed protein product, partial [marine sediment metagenome]
MRVGRSKYTDTEAAAQVAALILIHKAVADAHHGRYADTEARSAMGTIADANPLNHNRYAHPQAPPCRAATASLTGHATAAQITKLDGIPAGAGVPTKEFFIPVTVVKTDVAGVAVGDFATVRLDAASYIHFSFKCPHDF